MLPVHRNHCKEQCYAISALCVFRCLVPLPCIRVWKSIFGIRDLAKMWGGMWENAKILTGNGIWLQEGGLTKIWSHDVGYSVCLLGILIDMFSLFLSSSFSPPSCPTEGWKAISFYNGHKTHRNSKYQSKEPIYVLHLFSFYVNYSLLTHVFWVRQRTVFGKMMKKVPDAGLSWKRSWNVGSRLFTVPYFFVRSFRHTMSYRHDYLDF